MARSRASRGDRSPAARAAGPRSAPRLDATSPGSPAVQHVWAADVTGPQSLASCQRARRTERRGLRAGFRCRDLSWIFHEASLKHSMNFTPRHDFSRSKDVSPRRPRGTFHADGREAAHAQVCSVLASVESVREEMARDLSSSGVSRTHEPAAGFRGWMKSLRCTVPPGRSPRPAPREGHRLGEAGQIQHPTPVLGAWGSPISM